MTQDATEATPSPLATTAARGSYLVAAGIFLSRIAGLVREIAISGYLGVGAAADAFKAALRIPNLLQNLLGEGVLSASFIPVYAGCSTRTDDARRAARRRRRGPAVRADRACSWCSGWCSPGR